MYSRHFLRQRQGLFRQNCQGEAVKAGNKARRDRGRNPEAEAQLKETEA